MTLTPIEIGWLGLGILMFLMFLGVHIGFALMISGFIGFGLISGWSSALVNMALIPFDKLNSFTFAVIPLFILMSSLVSASGMGKEVYDFGRSWCGHIRGGLAIATTAGAAIFSAASGSSLACSLTFGKVAYPEMKKSGYDPGFAAGLIAAGGTMDVMIPPSGAFVLIGILAELSIGKLYIAGILPGIVQFLGYVVTILIMCTIWPEMGPKGPRTGWKKRFLDAKSTYPILILFVLVLGGIYGGIFTATEAGAIGAFAAFLIALIRRQWTWKRLFYAFMDTAKTTAMITVILLGAYVFNTFLAITMMPQALTDWVLALHVAPVTILLILMGFYLLLGTALDDFAVLILTLPLVYPIVEALGYDLIWWSIIQVMVMEIGFISPPFGINLFAIQSSIDLPVKTVWRGVLPFIYADFVILAILFLFPDISLYLVRLMS